MSLEGGVRAKAEDARRPVAALLDGDGNDPRSAFALNGQFAGLRCDTSLDTRNQKVVVPAATHEEINAIHFVSSRRLGQKDNLRCYGIR
jgi:hypothetical protein